MATPSAPISNSTLPFFILFPLDLDSAEHQGFSTPNHHNLSILFARGIVGRLNYEAILEKEITKIKTEFHFIYLAEFK